MSLTSSLTDTRGMSKGGNPCGSVPTTDTPCATRSSAVTATMDDTTAIRTAGNFGIQRCSTRITIKDEAPTASAATTVSPLLTPRTNALASPIKPFASTENPKSLGSCPTRIVSARPFM